MGREFTDSAEIQFDASEAIPRGSLVKHSSGGTVSLADITEEAIGFATSIASAANERVSVALFNKPGYHYAVAAGSFAVNAILYGRNNGQVDDDSSSSAKRVGRALDAAGAAGDIVRVLVDRPA